MQLAFVVRVVGVIVLKSGPLSQDEPEELVWPLMTLFESCAFISISTYSGKTLYDFWTVPYIILEHCRVIPDNGIVRFSTVSNRIWVALLTGSPFGFWEATKPFSVAWSRSKIIFIKYILHFMILKNPLFVDRPNSCSFDSFVIICMGTVWIPNSSQHGNRWLRDHSWWHAFGRV